jgi:UDP-glucose:(heptosyl)LPS alpha-1,3-glucosyltransferase
VEKTLTFGTAIPTFSSRKGGAERYLRDFCLWLSRRGWKVHVHAERWDEEEGIVCHRVRTLQFPGSLRVLSFAVGATRALENGRYDVTLGVGNTLRADVLQPHGGVHWAWLRRSVLAYESPALRSMKRLGRMLSLKQWASGWVENQPYRSLPRPRLVAISDMVKKDMVRWYRVPDDAVTVLYNGVNRDRFHPGNRRFREEIRSRHGLGQRFVMLFVSNNFRMKGLPGLLKALGRLKAEGVPPFSLVVLGRGRTSPFLDLARKEGIGEELLFAGTTTEPERYYGAADLLVHPTFYDACSLTVLEALASGLPVVTSTSNGASGVVLRGRRGRVIERPGDPEEIADAVRPFLTGEERVSPEFDAEAEGILSEEENFSRLEAILREAAGRESRNQKEKGR